MTACRVGARAATGAGFRPRAGGSAARGGATSRFLGPAVVVEHLTFSTWRVAGAAPGSPAYTTSRLLASPRHSISSSVASSWRSPEWWSRIEWIKRRMVSGTIAPEAEARVT